MKRIESLKLIEEFFQNEMKIPAKLFSDNKLETAFSKIITAAIVAAQLLEIRGIYGDKFEWKSSTSPTETKETPKLNAEEQKIYIKILGHVSGIESKLAAQKLLADLLKEILAKLSVVGPSVPADFHARIQLKAFISKMLNLSYVLHPSFPDYLTQPVIHNDRVEYPIGMALVEIRLQEQISRHQSNESEAKAFRKLSEMIHDNNIYLGGGFQTLANVAKLNEEWIGAFTTWALSIPTAFEKFLNENGEVRLYRNAWKNFLASDEEKTINPAITASTQFIQKIDRIKQMVKDSYAALQREMKNQEFQLDQEQTPSQELETVDWHIKDLEKWWPSLTDSLKHLNTTLKPVITLHPSKFGENFLKFHGKNFPKWGDIRLKFVTTSEVPPESDYDYGSSDSRLGSPLTPIFLELPTPASSSESGRVIQTPESLVTQPSAILTTTAPVQSSTPIENNPSSASSTSESKLGSENEISVITTSNSTQSSALPTNSNSSVETDTPEIEKNQESPVAPVIHKTTLPTSSSSSTLGEIPTANSLLKSSTTPTRGKPLPVTPRKEEPSFSTSSVTSITSTSTPLEIRKQGVPPTTPPPSIPSSTSFADPRTSVSSSSPAPITPETRKKGAPPTMPKPGIPASTSFGPQPIPNLASGSSPTPTTSVAKNLGPRPPSTPKVFIPTSASFTPTQSTRNSISGSSSALTTSVTTSTVTPSTPKTLIPPSTSFTGAATSVSSSIAARRASFLTSSPSSSSSTTSTTTSTPKSGSQRKLIKNDAKFQNIAQNLAGRTSLTLTYEASQALVAQVKGQGVAGTGGSSSSTSSSSSSTSGGAPTPKGTPSTQG